MADPEKQPPPESTPAQTQSAGTVTLNVSYVKSPRGILKIVEILLLMIAFSCIADYCGHCGGNSSFFLFSTIFPWILCIIIFILYLLCLVEQIPQVNWPLTVFINSVVWAIVILISSSLVADDVRNRNEGSNLKADGRWGAGAAFGFFSVVAFAIDAFLHFQLVRG